MINYSIPLFKIDIGRHPIDDGFNCKLDLSEYDVIFNVSDNPYVKDIVSNEKKVYWFPISEFGNWGYNLFFWFTHLMDNSIERGLKIYLHCQAGMHRSPILGYLYLRSKGMSIKEAFKEFKDAHIILNDDNKNWLEETLQHDIEYGRIPDDVIAFMQDVHKNKNLSMLKIMKLRNVMDFPPKSLDKKDIKKPVGQQQIDDYHKGIFNRKG